DALHRLGLARAEHARRDVLELARFAGPGWTRCRLACEVLGRAGAEDLERCGRAVLARRVRQPVAVGEHAPVAFVADGGRPGTEHVAVAQARVLEQPVTGAVHGVATEAIGDVAADAV